ncbi:MAG: hypothetical protein SFV53_03220 [Rickettsiales bacterium]|nr:hypothetical protein [Rickettsiales bacterium]
MNWNIAKNLVDFPEYKFTCIGYGNSIDGRGSAEEFNGKILDSLYLVIDKLKDNPDLLPFAPYLEKGIGGDRISDMLQNIIDEYICDYTASIMQELGLNGDCRHLSKNLQKQYSLLKNPYSKSVIKLLPRDILRDITISDKAGDISDEIISQNWEIRKMVDKNIGDAFFKASKEKRKSRIFDELFADPEIFKKILQEIKDYDVKNYNLDSDRKGVWRWLEDAKNLTSNTDLFSQNNVNDGNKSLIDRVESTIANFKLATEEKGFWSCFWTNADTGYFEHVHESYSQLIVSFLCNCSVGLEGLEIKKFYDNNQLITKFSLKGKNLFLYVKHSDNKQLKSGYEKILEKAKESKSDQYLYLVINFKVDKPKQLDSIKTIENDRFCKIHLIDAIIQETSENMPAIRFDGLDISKLYKAYHKASKGGKERHKETEVIKNNIIKPLFENRELIKGSSVQHRANKIWAITTEIFSETDDNNQPYNQDQINGRISNFANKYKLDSSALKESAFYFQGDDKSETIYKWCRNFNR